MSADDQPVMLPITTWVIEDNSHFREEIVDLITDSQDITCTKAFEDIEALEDYLKSETEIVLPHVVLMDIQLPGKSGIEGTRLLKDRYPDLTILMLTFHDDAEHIYEALKAGANGYLLKAVAYEKTLLAIRQARHGDMLMPRSVATKVLSHFNSPLKKRKYKITPREKEVLEQMTLGSTLKKIGETLFISEDTVNQHVKSIYRKLQVNSGRAAVAKALREQIID